MNSRQRRHHRRKGFDLLRSYRGHLIRDFNQFSIIHTCRAPHLETHESDRPVPAEMIDGLTRAFSEREIVFVSIMEFPVAIPRDPWFSTLMKSIKGETVPC